MEFNAQAIGEAVQQAMAVASERKLVLESLRQALIEDDIDKIKLHARQICGLTDEGCGISQGIDAGSG
jgi:hypothetical protein